MQKREKFLNYETEDITFIAKISNYELTKKSKLAIIDKKAQ